MLIKLSLPYCSVFIEQIYIVSNDRIEDRERGVLIIKKKCGESSGFIFIFVIWVWFGLYELQEEKKRILLITVYCRLLYFHHHYGTMYLCYVGIYESESRIIN
jgi:hypothetical protein